MTGAITGDHGLIQASGGAMTGQLGLASLPYNPSATGLYESEDHGVAAWKAGLLQLNYPPTFITSNHIATANEGMFVFRGFKESYIDFVTNAPFAVRSLFVMNDGQANLFLRGTLDTVLLTPGETAILRPYGSDFLLIGKSTLADTGGAVDFSSVGSEVGGTKNVTFSIYDVSRETTAITLVENPSLGIIKYTVASTTGVALGSKVFVTGTTYYDGEFIVREIVGSTISVFSEAVFVGTATGSMGVSRLSSRTNNLPSTVLVSDTLRAWDGAAGAELSPVSGGAFRSRAPSGTGYQVDTSSGTLVVNLDELYADYRVLYVHLVPNGRTSPIRSSPVYDVYNQTLLINNSSNNAGFLQIELGTVSGFQVGDSVTLSDTDNDGDYEVTEVVLGPPRIRLNTPYFAITSGLLTNNSSLQLVMDEVAGFVEGSFVFIKNLECLGEQKVTRKVEFVGDEYIVVKDSDRVFNTELGKSGVVEQACIAEVEFLENSSSSSSSSSIQSSQSSQSSESSVNSSSSSSSPSSSSSSSSSDSSESSSSP